MMRHGYLAVKLTGLTDTAGSAHYKRLFDAIASCLATIPMFSLHAPHRLTDPEGARSDGLEPQDIYLLDRLHVTHSSVVVACLELASFGVGAELLLASEFGIPVVGFHYEQSVRPPSRLVRGLPAFTTTGTGASVSADMGVIVRYAPTPQGERDLLVDIEHHVARILNATPTTMASSPQSIMHRLEQRRRELNFSIEDVATKAGVSLGNATLLEWAGERFFAWLESTRIRDYHRFDRSEIDQDRVLAPSLSVLRRMAAAVDIPFE
jgi:hypothetical protein